MSDNKEQEKVGEVVEEYSDIFVTEKDTFDVKVEYYNKNGEIFVRGIDSEEDEDLLKRFDKNEKCKEFIVTFKYPSQGDYNRIESGMGGINLKSLNIDSLNVRDFMKLEFGRLLCLIRKWTLKKPVNNNNILEMHPKIIKLLITRIRDKIGMDGII